MTLAEALNWIDLQHALGHIVRVHRMPDVGSRCLQVWLVVVNGDERTMVMNSESRDEINLMYNALQQYIGAHWTGAASV